MWRLLNLRALAFAAVVSALLIVVIVVGSRNLQNFDAALVSCPISNMAFAVGQLAVFQGANDEHI